MNFIKSLMNPSFTCLIPENVLMMMMMMMIGVFAMLHHSADVQFPLNLRQECFPHNGCIHPLCQHQIIHRDIVNSR